MYRRLLLSVAVCGFLWLAVAALGGTTRAARPDPGDHAIALGGEPERAAGPAQTSRLLSRTGARMGHGPFWPVSLILDDGSVEWSMGLNANYHGLPIIWINRFTPAPSDFPLTINQISILFPNPTMAHGNLVGLNVDLLVYEEPTGSGDPTLANKLYQQTFPIQYADGVTWSTYSVAVPEAVGPGDIYVGFANTYDHAGGLPYTYPAPDDENTILHRAWLAGNTNGADPDFNDLANNQFCALLDSMAPLNAGTWNIRAAGTSPGGPSPTPQPPTPTRTPTNTPPPGPTNTPPPGPTNTPLPVPTGTPLPVPTNTPPPGGTATPTPCPIQFSDVDANNPFYGFIRCLACRGIVSGYADGTYRPGNLVTRGQMAKFISNAAGYVDQIPPAQQTFSDVPPSNPFWLFIERAYLHGVVSGYADGTFRPGNTVTRGQAAKFVSNAAGYADVIPPAQQTFSDVPPSQPFWVFVERAYLHGVISGYADGTFRPSNGVTRGQTAKFIANAFYPGCETPRR